MAVPPMFVIGPDSGALNTRRVNRQRLLEAIRRLGPISRAELAKRTRLSPPTVSALVEELVAEVGLLREVGIGASSGGRPPILLEFNAEYGCLIGVDIGSRTTRFALADLQGHVLHRRQERTCADSCAATVNQVLDGIEQTVGEAGRSLEKLFAIGIGAPGMTDVQTGRVISAVNLPGWTDVPLRELVESRFRAPAQVDNDANMAALGERWQGVAHHANDFVFIALGAGVGAGVVIGGRLHRGHHWYAGEIGRMTLDYREWRIDFGDAATSRAASARRRSPVGACARRARARRSDREAAMRTIFDAASDGDAEAQAVVDELAVFLGTCGRQHRRGARSQLVVLRRRPESCRRAAARAGRSRRVADRAERAAPGDLGARRRRAADGQLVRGHGSRRSAAAGDCRRPAQRDLLSEAVTVDRARKPVAPARRPKRAHR